MSGSPAADFPPLDLRPVSRGFMAEEAIEGPEPAAARALIEVMSEDGFAIRYYSAKALGKLGSTGRLAAESRAAVSEALAELLDEIEPSLAAAAAAALEHAGEPAAAPGIFVYLDSYDPPNARALGALVPEAGFRKRQRTASRLVHACRVRSRRAGRRVSRGHYRALPPQSPRHRRDSHPRRRAFSCR